MMLYKVYFMDEREWELMQGALWWSVVHNLLVYLPPGPFFVAIFFRFSFVKHLFSLFVR